MVFDGTAGVVDAGGCGTGVVGVDVWLGCGAGGEGVGAVAEGVFVAVGGEMLGAEAAANCAPTATNNTARPATMTRR